MLNYILSCLSIVVGVVLHIWGDCLVGVDLTFLSLPFAVLALVLVTIGIVRSEMVIKKLKYIRLLHHMLAQKLDIHVEGYDPVTYHFVEELIEAGFPPASFDSPQSIYDSSRTIDSLGYKKGIKKLQDRYG